MDKVGSLVAHKSKHKKASSVSWCGFFKTTLSAFDTFQQSHQLMIHKELGYTHLLNPSLVLVWSVDRQPLVSSYEHRASSSA